MNKESKVSRRNLLLVAGGTAAVGVLAASPAREVISRTVATLGGARPASRTIQLATASYEQWAEQVGSTFALGGTTRMQLVGVRALQSGGARPANLGRSRAFVAFFEPMARQTIAGDLIYGVSHAQHGALQIFLTESPDPTTPARMLAVFN